MSYLLVPIRVDALFLEHGTSCVGPDADFENLPYYDKEKGIDINPDLPFLAESVVAPPFQDDNLYLKAGVHLHWALPDMLTTSKYGGKSTEFPAAPNRWYVKKEEKGAVVEWIVESDFIWASEKGLAIDEYCKISLNTDIHSGDKPFACMGRKVLLADWQKETANDRKNFKSWKTEWGTPLTALGWGSPAFDTFYPNCRSVFGLFDKDILGLNANDLSYTVIGWYDDSKNDDCFFQTLQKITAEVEDRNKTRKEVYQNDAEKQAKIAQYLSAALHFSLPDNAPMPAQGMVCYGKVVVVAGDNQSTKPEIKVAVAPTPTEAISALLAFGAASGDHQKKTICEDQLEAILFGDKLKAMSLDIGPKLREMRHEKSFVAIESGWVWTVRRADNQEERTALPPLPDLPDETVDLLDTLNQAQRNYDTLRHKFDSQLNALYADWYKYMICCYPPNGEIEQFPDQDMALQFIKNKTLREANRMKDCLGELSAPERDEYDSFQAYSNLDNSFAGVVKKCFNQLLELVDNENLSANDPQNRWEIQHVAAPRYWEPAPPAVVISAAATGEGLHPLRDSERFGNSDRADNDTRLACKILDGFNPGQGQFSADSVLNLVKSLDTGKAANKAFAPSLFGSNSWHTFKAEWEAELFPVATEHMITRKNGHFSPDFIRENYLLAENEAEYNPKEKLFTAHGISRSSSVYQGSAFVSQNARKQYTKAMVGFKAELSEQKVDSKAPLSVLADTATTFLQGNEIMTFSLGGFNLGLLQQDQLIRLRPADPLGFKEYQDFTNEVASVLKSGMGKSPNPLIDFHPFRSGALKIQFLRLIDTFGRIFTIEPDKVITSEYLTVPDQPTWMALMPRLSQAARTHFRWLQAEPDGLLKKESHSHPNSSPICGWIVPNLMDGSLMVYDADGLRLGNINQNGAWEVSAFPDLPGNAPIPLDKGNKTLKKVVDWVVKKSTADKTFLASFIGACLGAMDNIHPEDKKSQNALSVLMGRPMAVTRAMVDLELKGQAAFNQSWDDFRQDFKRQKRQTNGFTDIKIPFRIGEYRQYNDSLVGYWQESGDAFVNDSFAINDALTAEVVQDGAAGKKALNTLPKWLQDKIQEKTALHADGLDLIDFLNKTPDRRVKKQDLIQRFLQEGGRVWEALVEAGWLAPMRENASITHYSDTNDLNISIDGEHSLFTMLVDPFGSLHLSTGILPVKSINLPDIYYKNALRAIEVSFLSSPLVTPRTGIHISLPKETGYRWSWLDISKPQTDKRVTRRTWERTFLRKSRFIQVWENKYPKGVSGSKLWDSILASKWLKEDLENFEIGFPDMKAIDQGIEPDWIEASDQKAFIALLPEITEEIHPFSDRANFAGPLEIREGWLDLTNTTHSPLIARTKKSWFLGKKDPDLVVAWPLDKIENGKTRDISGNSKDGRITGNPSIVFDPTWGDVMLLNENNVHDTDSATLDQIDWLPSKGLTMEVWANIPAKDISGNFFLLMSDRDEDYLTGLGFDFCFGLSGTELHRINFPRDQWVHLAMSKSREGEIKVFMNAVQVYTYAIDKPTSDTHDWKLYVSADGNGLHGKMTRFRFYQRCLTQEEIKQDMQEDKANI